MKRIIIILLLAAGFSATAQNRQNLKDLPKGEEVLLIPEGASKKYIVVTNKHVYSATYNFGLPIFSAPEGTEIEHADYKKKVVGSNKVLILLNNGEAYEATLDAYGAPFLLKRLGQIPVGPNEHANEILGDDLYVMSNRAVYVSSDTPNHQIWTIDTLGLNVIPGFTFSDIDMDSAQQVWLATSTGLYKQGLGVATWSKVTGFTAPSQYLSLVFVDRQQRIWLAAFSDLYVSTDGGASFQNAPNTLVTGIIEDICDDAYGNIYFTQSGPLAANSVQMSQGGTQAFSNISLSFANDLTDPAFGSPLNDISGDTLVYLSTNAGLYTSADQGVTWIYQDSILAEHAHALTATADHRLLMSTNTGLFRRESSQNWTKLYPAGSKKMKEIDVFADNTGVIYCTGETVYTNTGGNPFYLINKSTDNGNTFVADTSGAKSLQVGMAKYFVDENGVQHAATYVSISGSIYNMVWKKEPGQNWALDTTGLSSVTDPALFNSPQCFGSDHAGNVYYGIRNNGGSPYMTQIFKRPITGGAWTSFGTIPSYTVVEINGRAGKLVAATFDGLFYHNGTSWTLAPQPPSLPANSLAPTATVDKNGIVWAHYDNGGVNGGEGIWYTTDLATWHYPQPNVDSAFFSRVVPLGDSLFALDKNFEGVYVFDTSTTILSIEKHNFLMPHEMVKVVPNPFEATTSLVFKMEHIGAVSLRVYDINGSLIYQIPGRRMDKGNQTLLINMEGFQSGIFIYHLQIDKKTYTGKLLKQ